MPFVFIIAAIVLSAILTVALRPSTPTATAAPSKLGDFKLPIPDVGTPVNVIFGDVWVDDWQVLWYGNLSNQAIKSTGGGKK